MKEYKEGVPFEVKMPNGAKINVMFIRTDKMSCNGCIFVNTDRMSCWDLKCTNVERKDGLNGIYIGL